MFFLWRSGNGVYIYSQNMDIQLYMLCCISPPRVKTGIAFFPYRYSKYKGIERQRAAVNRFIEATLFRPQIKTVLHAARLKTHCRRRVTTGGGYGDCVFSFSKAFEPLFTGNNNGVRYFIGVWVILPLIMPLVVYYGEKTSFCGESLKSACFYSYFVL